MPFAKRFIHLAAKHLGEPVIDGCKTAEERCSSHGVVKVAHDKHGVMQVKVRGDGTQEDTCQPTQSKHEYGAQCKQHGCCESNGSLPDGVQPIEEENFCRDADDKRQ